MITVNKSRKNSNKKVASTAMLKIGKLYCYILRYRGQHCYPPSSLPTFVSDLTN